jgi:hypothetical protein
MKFVPLTSAEHRSLVSALQNNGEGISALTMTPDTTFEGSIPLDVDGELPSDAEVINAIKSVPTHYADF